MQQLWVHYSDHYQKIEFDEYSVKRMDIGPSIEHAMTVLDFPFVKGPLELKGGEDGFTVSDSQGRIGFLEVGKPVSLTQRGRQLTLSLRQAPRRSFSYFTGHVSEISFGVTDPNASVNVTGGRWDPADTEKRFSLLRQEDGWTADVEFGCPFYLNGQRVSGTVQIRTGDVMQWLPMEIRLKETDVLEVRATAKFSSGLPPFAPPVSEVMRTYPEYRRTPRLVHEAPEEKVSLSFPLQEQPDDGRGLWLIILPPLVMLIVMSLVVILIPRGLFIIISISMFIVTIFTSTVQYFRERKRRRLAEEKRRRVYAKYLENIREELYELRRAQYRMLRHHYPPFEELKKMASGLSGRIWEKTRESRDFLHFRLGTGKVPASYQLTLSSGDLANREVDDLLEQSQTIEKVYSELDHAPITADLSKGIIGLFGKEDVIRKEIGQIVGQLAFFHSYHDLRFVYIFDGSKYAQEEWMKWLPHFTLPHMHAKGFIHDERTRDQLLGSLYEILRERDNREDRDKTVFLPHLVFIVSDYKLIGEHVILEYLEGKDHEALGISVIFTAAAKERITENVHMLVRYVNSREGDILIRDRLADDTRFMLDVHEAEGNEPFARMLRTLDHQVGMTNSLPMSAGFLEMYGTRDAESLPILDYWQTNESSRSLAVPIGYKGRDDLLELNLHERAHGPHGLLAGTTGSGKSEFLQTYILSLAVNFHPHEVAFLLIDYKGGGMAQPFRNIPHLLGTITNIEGSRNFSLRALASIKSELKRRQRLFDRYTVTHINEYTALHKNGVAEEPLPHLFLISDEFAELKSEEPEFIRELVSAARIGRSLGVHLILATQKPGGIIDDQIWSNARFRVALKVQDASDSKEILKNGDAATITVTGRGYLQVGNNEVYELFQSAWSGAPYLSESHEGEEEIALVTDLGLEPLSSLSVSSASRKSGLTEIEAVTARIAEAAKEIGAGRLSSPWLPPLPDRLSRTGLRTYSAPGFAIGLVDEPEKQSQRPVGYNPATDGNVGIFGSPGYGKSYTLQSLLLGIAETMPPEEAHLYLMDYGNGALLPLRQLPHTADYLTLDEELKRDKLVRLIRSEINRRKTLFQQAEVSTIQMYNKISAEQLPLLFIAIDNYDIIRDEMEELELQLNQFGRDGQSLGIHFLLAATRPQSVRQTLMNNLKLKIVHYFMDSTEMYGVIGRPPFTPEPFPGRAIIKREDALFAQIPLPADGSDDFEVLEQVKTKVAGLKKRHESSVKPEPIPMLPAELPYEQFKILIKDGERTGLIPAGLDEETVRPVEIDFAKNRHLLLIGLAQRGKTNAMKLLLRSIRAGQSGPVAVFDSFDRGLAEYAHDPAVSYTDTKEKLENWLSEAEEYMTAIESEYIASLELSGGTFEPVPSYLLIDGYARFLQTADSRIQDRISRMMKNYSHLGFNVIVSGSNAEISKGYDAFTNELKLVRQALIFMKKSEQTILNVPYERKEEEPPAGFAHYVLNGNSKKIMIPFCSTEKETVR
ncbi:type VII secretion protein EssC [Edaphobacillus lindanitolerans]|uniref:DNA segregation ATPase FtsK/SpoIIIE, S-DNA-T family n=1 Tax=Edaphobacillus lindanitolerans TaxID=550447 RepID=A0A1U7PHZ5_9BACI|nr:type VII secretion protein EssC [Edaphobacillus lindanitolerans]SIT70692.1 DNA segregation ATPase FtsK/SpoIIIE, S-DNA-T family [Edaphobacillus lindanitolerans]